MLLPTLLPSLFLLPYLLVASAAKHDSLRPLHQRAGLVSSSSSSLPRLVARQDEESTCPDCLSVTDIGEVCLAALPAGSTDTEADGLPPRNDCFCSQKLFDLSLTCGACIKADGSDEASTASTTYLQGFDDFRAACISSGFAITPSTEETEVVASTTSSAIDDSSSVTSAAPEEPTTAAETTATPTTTAPSAVTTHKTSATSKASQASASKSPVASTTASTGGAQGGAMVHVGLVGAVGLVALVAL